MDGNYFEQNATGIQHKMEFITSNIFSVLCHTESLQCTGNVAMKCVITMKPDQPFCGCSFGITNS